MTYEPEQYERVARYLDGEPVELSQAERELAETLRADEARLAVFDAPVPAAAMARAERRMIAAAARPSLRRRVLQYVVGIEAAAVAGLILVIGTLAMIAPNIEDILRAPVPTDAIIEATAEPATADLDVMRAELDELEAEIVASVPQQDQLEIESMEQGLKDFLQDIRDVTDEDLLNES